MKEKESKFLKTPSQEKVPNTSEILKQTLITTKAFDKPLWTEDIEVIPAFPASEVLLIVENIPPLDILYSPEHKAIVKR